MTSTELVVERMSGKQLEYIAATDFVPKAYRGNLPAIMACVATGREYGLGDMESLRLIDVIEGRPELRAEAKLKLARRAGHSITIVDETPTAVTIRGQRADNGDEMVVSYTAEDAKLAGLLSKPNWQKHPREMLWARAVTILCRRLFGDAVPDLPDQVEGDLMGEAEEERAALEAATVPRVPVQDGGEAATNGEGEPASPPGVDVGQVEGQLQFEEMAKTAQRKRKPNPETGV